MQTVHCWCEQCCGKAVPTSTEYCQYNNYLDYPMDYPDNSTRSIQFIFSHYINNEKSPVLILILNIISTLLPCENRSQKLLVNFY